jgi:hypothetical protein
VIREESVELGVMEETGTAFDCIHGSSKKRASQK